jgi:hypothetical protein
LNSISTRGFECGAAVEALENGILFCQFDLGPTLGAIN